MPNQFAINSSENEYNLSSIVLKSVVPAHDWAYQTILPPCLVFRN